jgi:hypothetical protein
MIILGIRTCCGIVIAENNSPIILSSNGESQTLATLTITVIDPASTVRLMASVASGHSLFEGQTRIVFEIRRADNSIVRILANSDVDNMTTTFFAFDNPGQGTFTYTLRARNIFSTIDEFVESSIFTAEELSVL